MSENPLKAELRSAFDLSKGRAKYATIRERVVTAAKVDGIHLCQLIAAMTIASIGLNINSTEAIIGAMLICPLMGSVLAMSLAVATMDMRLFKRSGAGMLLQCGICLATSALYFLLSPLNVDTTEVLANSSPTIWDLIIALVGGFAGALGLSRRIEPKTLVAGVAVATALMPPLCAVGYGLADGGLVLAASALYEFLINVVFIAFGSALVFVWLRMPFVGDLDGDGKEDAAEKAEAERESHALRHRLVFGLAVFAIPCLYFTLQAVQSARLQNATVMPMVDAYDTKQLTQELEVVCPGFISYRLGEERAYQEDADTLEQRVIATVVTRHKLDATERRKIRALVRLHVDEADEVLFEVQEPEG